MKISISNLNFCYEKSEILKNINFEFSSGEFVCIIGPNGGGKSTLLKLILGLVKPSSGTISIDGKEPKDKISELGYVPQNIDVNPSFPMSVLEVALMGRLRRNSFGFYSKEDKILAKKALEKVGMAEFAGRKISALSGGQKQRVYIARALTSGAKMLILDEPTASIDPKGQAEIYSLLKELNSNGTGILMVSHDVNMALGFATKVAFVSKELVLHNIHLENCLQIEHLAHSNAHFCGVELAGLWGNLSLDNSNLKKQSVIFATNDNSNLNIKDAQNLKFYTQTSANKVK